jgi:hypothetical protein
MREVEKLVRFKETVTIIITSPKPQDEIELTWYSPEEMLYFEQEATIDDLLAARTKKILLHMREELHFLRETWMDQLKKPKDTSARVCPVLVDSVDERVPESVSVHNDMVKGSTTQSYQPISGKPSSKDPPSALKKPRIGWPRDPPFQSDEPKSVSPNSVFENIAAGKSTKAAVKDPASIPPPPVFGKRQSYDIAGAMSASKRNPAGHYRPLPPPTSTPKSTPKSWDSRRKGESYLRTEPRKKPTHSLPPTKAPRQRSRKTPPPPLHKPQPTFKRSLTEPTVSSTTHTPTTASSASTMSYLSEEVMQDHGWSVPLGVHKVICKSPGLHVTCDVHRRSAPVKRLPSTSMKGCVSSGSVGGEVSSRRTHSLESNLIIPPGSFIEVLETQVHGDRVRGKIAIKTEPEVSTKMTRKSSSMLSKLKGKKDKASEPAPKVLTHQYTGWVSLQWSGKTESRPASFHPKPADEDSGPWTQPVTLGVYRVTCRDGLHVTESIECDSALMGLLEKGKYVEVIETRVYGDRVRARCIFSPANPGEKSSHGWISLFNTVTGSSGASALPLGSYVAWSKANCLVTEGASLYSKVQGKLSRGTLVEIVATRIEDGAVRGLISTGGHVTLLIIPDDCYEQNNGF